MSKEKASKNQPSGELRSKAEQIYNSQTHKFEELDEKQQLNLIQELQINKIELEIQNEELRQAQMDLEKSRVRFRKLFQKAPVGYIVLDSAGIIVQTNQTFKTMLGMDEADLKGKALADFICEDDQPIFRARYNSIYKNPEEKSIEVSFGGSDSKHFYSILETAWYNDSPMENSSGNELLVSVSDITKRKLAENKSRELLRDKDMLLKEVHHRIKNNMAAITALLSIQASTIEIPEAEEALKKAMSRMDTMRILYEKLYTSEWYHDVPLKSYMKELLSEILKILPEEKHISLIDEVDDFSIKPNMIFHMGIIINELITNSIKYAFPEATDAEITLNVGLKDNRVKMVLADNGKGFSEDVLETSTGFGLKLVEAMVDQLDGEMSCETNNGSAFTIEFDIDS